MPTDAFDMAIVHRVFRNELRGALQLLRDVQAGDTKRSKVVGGHVKFIVAALQHHHVAEDELVWPKLQARATCAALVSRMEDEHRGIAEAVSKVQAITESWVPSADPQRVEELAAVLEDLCVRADQHFEDEERAAVPLINEHLTPGEWKEAVSRAAGFLSWKNLRLGLVLGGYILDAATVDEGPRLMANVPLPKRVLAQMLSTRVFVGYRKRLGES